MNRLRVILSLTLLALGALFIAAPTVLSHRSYNPPPCIPVTGGLVSTYPKPCPTPTPTPTPTPSPTPTIPPPPPVCTFPDCPTPTPATTPTPVATPSPTPEPTPQATPPPTPELTLPPTDSTGGATGDSSPSPWFLLIIPAGLILFSIYASYRSNRSRSR